MQSDEAIQVPEARQARPCFNVTLPVYNEAAQLASSVRRLLAFLAGQYEGGWEVVIADNGSTDETLAIARQLAAEQTRTLPDAGCRIPDQAITLRVRHRDPPGRGAALREAWLASEADIVSYMDVDLSTDLTCLPALLEPLRTGIADLAIGSRLLPAAQTTRGWKRECLSRGYNRLLHWVLGLRVADAQCGFKALSRRAAQALLPCVRDDGWFFDTELLALAQHSGWRVAEVPVRWVDDPGTTVRLWPTVCRDLRGVWRLRRALGRGGWPPASCERGRGGRGRGLP